MYSAEAPAASGTNSYWENPNAILPHNTMLNVTSDTVIWSIFTHDTMWPTNLPFWEACPLFHFHTFPILAELAFFCRSLFHSLLHSTVLLVSSSQPVLLKVHHSRSGVVEFAVCHDLCSGVWWIQKKLCWSDAVLTKALNYLSHTSCCLTWG